MRGSLVHRGENRWGLVLDHGYVKDPKTGLTRRKQQWINFRGDKQAAGNRLTEIVRSMNRGEFVAPAKTNLIDYLREWIEKAAPALRPETVRTYKSIIERRTALAPIATLPLQRVRATDLEGYYANLKLSPGTIAVHHAILHRALKSAARDRLIVETRPPTLNIASAHDSRHERNRHGPTVGRPAKREAFSRPRRRRPRSSRRSCTSRSTPAPGNPSYTACSGLTSISRCTVTIARQLDRAGTEPIFGITKTDRIRVIRINDETVTRLRSHKAAQATLKMATRMSYADFNLVFAKEPEDLQTRKAALGQPLKTLSQARFQRLVESAGVRKIKFHGVRHTVATLLLQASVPVHVVAERLGHAQVTMTLEVYAHVLPTQQADAAARLGAVLHG